MSTVSELKAVLVVDDEEDIGLLMRLLLSTEGYEVLHVKNLSEARYALTKQFFHTVFLDLNLQTEFGLDLLPDIRRQETTPVVAVITAQKEPGVRQKVKDSNVDHLIEKPFNRKRILEVMKRPH